MAHSARELSPSADAATLKGAATFEALEHKPHPNWAGTQARVDFPNGYGASVIRADHSYGGENGLYELAVILDGDLCYDTPITDDVLGHLTPAAVTEALGQIAALPKAGA